MRTRQNLGAQDQGSCLPLLPPSWTLGRFGGTGPADPGLHLFTMFILESLNINSDERNHVPISCFDLIKESKEQRLVCFLAARFKSMFFFPLRF